MPAQYPGAHIIIHGQFVIGVIVTIDHKMARFGQQTVTIAAQMAELNAFASLFILARDRLNRLQGGLIHHPAVGKINDHHIGVRVDGKKL